MLTTAALQFHARAHQELLKDERIVFAKVLGRDEGGEKAARGRRVEDAMSMQFMFHMLEWQDDMDRMLYVLPLIGTVFKKTYWSDMKGRPVSELVLPSEMVVAYHAQDWIRARKTHKLYLTHNEVVEQQRIMAYLDVDIGPEGERDSATEEPGMLDDERNQVQIDGDQPHEILECHCWYDLDDDGYEEPYIVTVDRATEQLLRIVPRFRRSDVRDREDGIIMAIDAIEYVTPFKFFPSVDSKVYGTGFGQLLGPLNRAVNSVINQLLDAGTLSNMQSGFLGRGVRVTKGGRVRFRPGEWLELSSTGDDLRKGVFPLPVKEPSNVLFQLLGYLVQAGKEVSSVAEIMTGQNPGQNQPFSTTQTVLGEGMQVFLGIYKRIYRALATEYRRVYDLNYMYLSDAIYSELLDEPAGADVVADFDPKGLDILPQADPNMANSIRKQQRVQSLLQAQQAGMNLNAEYIQRQFLESIDEPNIEEVMKVQPPPPTEAELEDKRFYAKLELDAKDLELRAEMNQNQPLRDEAAALANVAKARHMKADIEIKRQQAGVDITLKEMDADMKAMDADNALANRMMDNADKQREHQMKQAEGTMKLAQEGIKLEQAQAKANEPNTTQ
jgi:chaperonin GroES